ncbi:MAG: glycine--tRNA ligase subunit beta [Bacillota bacterium]|nr:glycine--tRNA ligase subunit beta [Bacillota bacterium]
MKDYLLEIGVEELPARYINSAMDQLEESFIKLLNENKLAYKEIIQYSTPRRLSLLIKDLQGDLSDDLVEIKGPSAKIAYDDQGNPSKALQGFMKSQGLSDQDIEVRDNYIYGKKLLKAKTIEEIFSASIPAIIKAINFPKNMKWAGKNIKFSRPIRWLVSLYGSQVLPIDLEGISCSNVTKGHRFLGSDHIVIEEPSAYEKTLRENYVIVSHKERLNIIKREANKLAKEISGEIIEDPDLLNELTNITEYPTPILGSIKEEYLELPNIVITTSMKEHLRFIPIYKDSQNLLPYFVSIVNGTDAHKDVIIKGNEKVLSARLEDAKFFYREDLATDFVGLKEKLTGITYHEKLGSMKTRVDRIEELVEKIGDQLDIAKESKDQVKRAAQLSKNDLLTHMVDEFSELQGIMGEIYAKKAGEESLVAEAISAQYKPRFYGDDLPETTVGSILSIGEKLDALAGMFAIGMIPTGSQDPFGLRRSALGIINIIRKNNWRLSLKEAIKDALFIYVEENSLVFDYESVSKEIYDFFLSRIKVILLDQGVRYDLVDAIIGTQDEDIYKIFKKAQDLKEWFEEADRSKEVETFARLNNIAVKAQSTDFDPEIFNDYEKALYITFTNVKENIETSLGELDYKEILEAALSLQVPINNFLDNVLVFDEDENLKNNRLGLLARINNFIHTIIDFSKIVM